MRPLLTCLLVLALGCAPVRMLSPTYHRLQLLEDCRELRGVELVCRVAPKGFPDAAFDLVVPYREGLSIRQMKRAEIVAKRLLNTPAHRAVHVRLAALAPGESSDRQTAYLGK